MGQVDRNMGLVGNVAMKAPCIVATTASLGANMSGLPIIDGVQTVAGDRVLRKDESDATLNGIWSADTGVWDRAQDMDGVLDVVQGTMVYIAQGTINSNAVYLLTTADPITIGTSSLAFTLGLFSSLGATSFLQAGTGAVARTAQNKMRDIVSVTDFGALGNGVADDSAAFQLAHDSLSADGILYIPAGTYLLANVYITKSDLTIICIGTLKPLTINSTAVVIGQNAAGKTVAPRRLHGNIRVNSGATFSTYTGATGIRINCLYESDLLLDAMGCNRNLDFSPDFTTYPTDGATTSASVVYNQFRLGSFVNGKEQIYIDPKTALSVVNENTFYGGRFSIDSGTFTTNVRYIQITSGGGSAPNNNRFVRPSFEGAGKAWDCDASYNSCEHARLEVLITGTPGVDYAAIYIDIGANGNYSEFTIDYGIDLYSSTLIDQGAGTAVDLHDFTVVGDVRGYCYPGALLRLTIAAVDYYAHVLASSYSAPDTSIRVTSPIVTGNPTAVYAAPASVNPSALAVRIGWLRAAVPTVSNASLLAADHQNMVLTRSSLAISNYDATRNALRLYPGSSAAEQTLRIFNFTVQAGYLDNNANGLFRSIGTGATGLSQDTAPATNNVAQTLLASTGRIDASVDSSQPLNLNRITNDGTLINFLRDGASQGTISVAGGVVALNAFLGVHWSQLEDNAYIADLPQGTVLEQSTKQMCYWPDTGEDNRLYRVRLCATAASQSVGGTFHTWDLTPEPKPIKATEPTKVQLTQYAAAQQAVKNLAAKVIDEAAFEAILSASMPGIVAVETHNAEVEERAADVKTHELYKGCMDMQIATSGLGWIRMAPGQVVKLGDLVESSDIAGCARVQSDALYKASTIGAVRGLKPIAVHTDGSFTVACGLMRG